MVQNFPDSLEISAKKGHKFNEEDVYELEGEIYFTLAVRKSNTPEEFFIFTSCETGQVIKVKMS